MDRILDALETNGQKVQRKGSAHAMAQCPAHEDRAPSLSIDHRGDKTLIRCHAGCQTDEILDSLGLELKDLFDDELPEKGFGVGVVERTYVYENYKGDPWILKDRMFPKSFLQRLPGTEPGQSKGLGGRAPVLYKLPALIAGIKEGYTVWFVEGEKDVETAMRHGLLATCAPSITGEWQEGYTNVLSRAVEVMIVADQDEPGKEYAAKVRSNLRAAGVRCRVLRPRKGKDLTDHFKAGFGVEDFTVDTSLNTRPRGMTGDVLAASEFPPLHWAIPDLLPAGLAILAGSPKCGKSAASLDLGLAVAAGGVTLGGIPANRGSVLYLAREDGYRRIQSRMDALLGGPEGAMRSDISKFEVIPTEEAWTGGQEGLAAMTEWAEEVGDPLLVILDTLAKVEPSAEDGDRYRQDYAMMARYKSWADLHNCCVLVVHHDRKSTEGDGDIFTKISGTRAITGACDTMLYLERKRGEQVGKLHLTGRDVADQEIELIRSGLSWKIAGPDNLPEPAYLRAVR